MLKTLRRQPIRGRTLKSPGFPPHLIKCYGEVDQPDPDEEEMLHFFHYISLRA